MEKAIEWCDLCGTVGKQSKLKIYQINFKEAIKLCEDDACNYPIRVDKLISRKFEDVQIPLRRKNRQTSTHISNFTLNPLQNVPQPRPVFISGQVPGNIIRPQPVSALPQTKCIMAASSNLGQLTNNKHLNGSKAQASPFHQKFTISNLSSPVENLHCNQSRFHSVQKTISQNSIQSSLTNHIPSTVEGGAQSKISANIVNHQDKNDTFMSPDDEIDIDTSEVTEFIDVHFNSDELLALTGVAPRQTTHPVSPCEVKLPSPTKGSAKSPVIQSAETNTRSSPFIPIRSNLGNGSSVQKPQEKHTNIKPMVSNNSIDNVISQELEIETSSNAGSPFLGDTTYFVIPNTGKKRGRPPKPKGEISNSIKIAETDVKTGNTKTEQVHLPEEKKVSNTVPSLHTYKYYPQWQNEEALCWLDVVLCLYVHSKTIRKIQMEYENVDLSNTILITLFKAYQQACQLVNKCREKTLKENLECKSRTRSGRLFSDPEESDSDAANDSPNTEMMKELYKHSSHESGVKTGAGLSCSKDFTTMLPSGDQENYKTAFTNLRDIREAIWKKIEPRLQCVKGKNDSPVLAIPLIVKDNLHCEKNFSVEYDFIFTCISCGHGQTDRYFKVLPTFPATEKDFNMKNPYFKRPCFKCNALGQHRQLKINKLHGALMLHFSEGLPHSNFKRLEFSHGGVKYAVKGFVQYRNDPDHFVTWIRHPTENKWLEFDDLKSPICKFESKQPDIDPKQIHIVMWESCKPANNNKISSHIVNGEKSHLTVSATTTTVNPKFKMQFLSKRQNSDVSRNMCETVYAKFDQDDNIAMKKSSSGLASYSVQSTSKETLEKNINTNMSLSKAVIKHQKTVLTKESNSMEIKNVSDSLDFETVNNVSLFHNKESSSDKSAVNSDSKSHSDNKMNGMFSTSDRSEEIVKNLIRNITADSSRTITPKHQSKRCIEDEKDTRKKALAKLWKPKPEAVTKIRKVWEKKMKKNEDENKWKPADKVKLTEQKYRKVTEKQQMTKSEIVYPKSENAGTMTTVNREKSGEKGHIFAKSSNDIPESIHNQLSKYTKLNSTKDIAVEKAENGLDNNKSGNKHAKSRTGRKFFPYDQHEPTKANNLVHSKQNYASSEKIPKATVCDNVSKVNDMDLHTINASNNESHTSGRQSESTSVFSRFSIPTKTFSGYRQKSFSGFQSSTFKQKEAPSPTPSTKSEIVFPTKRKTSISNFITVKRPKFQNSSNFSTPSSTPISLVPNCCKSNLNNGNQAKESDILQDLYNALDIPVPNDNPDSLDLLAIENSSCLQNTDDFLDQLL